MVKKYFVRANTANGCINLAENNLKNQETVFMLSGRSRAVKTYVMQEIVKRLEKAGADIECAVCPFDIKHIDAVIARDTKFAAIDEDCAGDLEKAESVDTDIVFKAAEDGCFKKLKDKADGEYRLFYASYAQAKKIHDEWEQIYLDRIDFDRLSGYGKGIINQLIGNKKGNKGTQNFERFFGASTIDGSVNYIDNITENVETRYFIKGRPGTGKSTFMKRLAGAANAAGFDTEVYYCSFDEKSLDMVLVPELSFCVFDSTAPHEMFPKRENDKILDFYEESGLLGTDEACAREIELVGGRYRHRISEGLAHLRLGNLYMNEREFYFKKDADFDAAESIADGICEKIK